MAKRSTTSFILNASAFTFVGVYNLFDVVPALAADHQSLSDPPTIGTAMPREQQGQHLSTVDSPATGMKWTVTQTGLHASLTEVGD